MKRDMTNGKEWKLILLFTLPIIAGNLLQQLYNIIDGIVVGNFVSELAFASVTTCTSLTVLYLCIATGLSVGVSVITSQYYGAGKKEDLPVAIDTAVILLGICGLAVSVIGVLLSPFLLENVLNVPEENLPQSILYMRIYSAGLFFQFIYNGIAATLRGFGDSKATLYFLLIATLLNTGLDLLFVISFRWSVAGAAYATVLAQFICVVVSYIYLRKRFPVVKGGRHWDGRIAATMAKLGLPIAVQFGVVAIGGGSMQRLVNGFDATVPGIVAAYGAGIRLDNLVFVLILGFQSGLVSFTGQNIGAGRIDRVKRGLYSTLVMSLSATIIMSVVFFLNAEAVVSFFGLEAGSLQIGSEIVRFMCFFFWLFSAYQSLGGVLQGAGDTILTSFATLSGLAFRITFAYVTVNLGLIDHSAAWVSHPLSWTWSSIIVCIRYFSGRWKNKAVAGELKRG